MLSTLTGPETAETFACLVRVCVRYAGVDSLEASIVMG
jgi:hypothetical protein